MKELIAACRQGSPSMNPQLFDHLGNLYGQLNGECRARLQAVLENPSDATWDRAYTLIVRSRGMLTLWQAVLAIDPSFPKTGPAEGMNGRRLERWKRVPDRETLLKAVLFAAEAKEIQ